MNKFLVIGSDERLRIAADVLAENEFESRYIGTDSFNEEIKRQLTEWVPDYILLPVLSMKPAIPPELITEKTVIFAGQTDEVWKRAITDKDVRLHPYLEDERFIWKNARLTAEAFIQVYYGQIKQQIAGTHFIVAGFGRVGKAVAQALHGLQAAVTVAARSEVQLAEAEVLGYRTLQLSADTEFTDGYLVNTIPFPWLEPAKCGNVRIFDLASAPGCLKQPLSPEYYTIHLKLPGIHFPADAAAVLAGTVLRSIEERGATCWKENESD